jgi:hypothetical protein
VTLAPLIDPAIRGVEGKRRELNATCAAPGCITPSQEGHHLWPRSYLRGEPTEWVRLPSGRVIANVVGLCRRHHNEVTGAPGGHKAMIQLTPDEVLIWLSVDEFSAESAWVHHGLLHPQPFSETPVKITQPKKKPHHHTDLEEGETCQSCGYTRPLKKKSEPGPKRRAKSYTMRVPDDSEIGSDVLDEWVAQFATILGFGEDAQKSLTRYHVFAVVMAWAMQHRQDFVKDIAEANAA